MRITLIKELPEGHPGDILDIPPDVAQIFLEAGIAEVTPDPVPVPKPRVYRRRDLESEG